MQREYKFVPFPVQGTDAEKMFLLRLNSLCQLYYFIKVALRRGRLTDSLHRLVCDHLERDRIKDLLEMPRDHFKTTVCSEGLPIWWSLPVRQEDEDFLLRHGYPDEFIRWLHRVHNPDVRNLLVSESITNAGKLGSRTRWHFESNALFRALFSEILPTTAETWTNFSLHIRRPKSTTGGAHGEGTFDFIGVGGALQSRHYHNIIEDDLIGKKALESPSIMEKTIDYHRLVIGAFDQDDPTLENNELLVGNRWGYYDLNSHVREHEPWFHISSHSAMGGCCEAHPADTPIFPEEFSKDKLERIRQRQGSFFYSCQYLNNPVSPEDAEFRESWLQYYKATYGPDGRIWLHHETKNGVVRKDIPLKELSIAMCSDPNHSGNAGAGRCRHAIVVLGGNETDHYLLDVWAAHATTDAYLAKLYETARVWGQRRVGLETIGAQKYLEYHINYRNRFEKWPIRIEPLKGEVDGPDGTPTRNKLNRIRTLSPLFEGGHFWVRRTQQEFYNEYITFPKGKFLDILDALAYAPQMAKISITQAQYYEFLRHNQQRARQVNKPYSVC